MKTDESISGSTIKSQIVDLAERAGVRYQRLPDDELAEVVTRLSDGDVVADEIEDLVVAMKRADAINGGAAGPIFE
jgi:Glu-tRNA(Gln) amidotransferase subunit E-like FAD-binding protein